MKEKEQWLFLPLHFPCICFLQPLLRGITAETYVHILTHNNPHPNLGKTCMFWQPQLCLPKRLECASPPFVCLAGDLSKCIPELLWPNVCLFSIKIIQDLIDSYKIQSNTYLANHPGLFNCWNIYTEYHYEPQTQTWFPGSHDLWSNLWLNLL